MTDFRILPTTFAETEFRIECVSALAKFRLGGAVGFTIKKSEGEMFVDACVKDGLTIEFPSSSDQAVQG